MGYVHVFTVLVLFHALGCQAGFSGLDGAGECSAAPGGSPTFCLRVDEQKVLGMVSSKYVSFTVDSGNLLNDQLLPESKNFVAATKALSPAYLRIGGTSQDTAVYAVDSFPADNSWGNSSVFTRRSLDQLFDFANRTSVELVFGLNAGWPRVKSLGLGGKEQDAWQPDNVEHLFEYVKKRNHQIYHWTLGNEPNSWFHFLPRQIPPEQLACDFVQLRATIQKYFSSSKLRGPSQHRVIGPCVSTGYYGVWNFPDFTERFANTLKSKASECKTKYPLQAGAILDHASFHYYGLGRDTGRTWDVSSLDRTVDPLRLNMFRNVAASIQHDFEEGDMGKGVWITETASSSGGGDFGVSNRFVSSLWYLDQMASFAQVGHGTPTDESVMVRQQLWGGGEGSYNLLDPKTYSPLPDYWAALLWKGIIGEASILDGSLMSIDPADAPSNEGDVRAYVFSRHTSSEKATVVLALNFRPVPVVLRIGSLPESCTVWRVGSTALDGTDVFVNGHKMEQRADGSIPDVQPLGKKADVSTSTLDKESYTFFLCTTNHYDH